MGDEVTIHTTVAEFSNTQYNMAHVKLLEEFLPVHHRTASHTIRHKVEQLGRRLFLRVPRLSRATTNEDTKCKWAGGGRTAAIQKLCVFQRQLGCKHRIVCIVPVLYIKGKIYPVYLSRHDKTARYVAPVRAWYVIHYTHVPGILPILACGAGACFQRLTLNWHKLSAGKQ